MAKRKALALRAITDDPKRSIPWSDDDRDDVIDELHTVNGLLQLVERITGVMPTSTFIDGAFTTGQLHALALTARARVGALLKRTVG